MIGKATSGKRRQQHRLQESSSHPFRTRPPDQKTNQNLFEVLVDRDPVVIDGRFEHHLLQVREIAREGLVVAVGDLVGLGEDRRPPFHVEKPHRPAKIKAQLLRIEQMKDRRVVPPEPQMLEARPQLGRARRTGPR